METKKSVKILLFFLPALLATFSCNKLLDKAAENQVLTPGVDYSISDNAILPLIGLYARISEPGWENYPLNSIMGDDVNAGGTGDQGGTLPDLDMYSDNVEDTYWMFNNVWTSDYNDIYAAHEAMDQIELYRDHGADKAKTGQYLAEARVLRAWQLFNLSRMWGKVFIPLTSDRTEMHILALSTKEEVMKHISAEMDAAIPDLPALNPNKRTDITGGVTRYTALAMKARANLELKNYQAVADATSQIISSGEFALEPDYYELFKLKGRLNDENLFELQYPTVIPDGPNYFGAAFSFFGPDKWTPKNAAVSPGWGFFEPSLKYIKFMLDRSETVRLETSVIFTNRGITELRKDPRYAVLPSWISNTTRSGDIFNDSYRELFCSGKHYMPSDQIVPGQSNYGTGRNLTCIRYAEVLLMYAEALTRGASGTAMSALDAVNLVRERAALSPLSSLTSDQVMDEKFAELAMEWGIRYYDIIRLQRWDELSYDGRVFVIDKIYYPYPKAQAELLPVLKRRHTGFLAHS